MSYAHSRAAPRLAGARMDSELSPWAQMRSHTRVLASLVSSDVSIRRYLGAADIDETAVSLTGSAQDMWDAALIHAKNRDRLKALIEAVRSDYESSQKLRELSALAERVEQDELGLGHHGTTERQPGRAPTGPDPHSAVTQASAVLSALQREIEVVEEMIRRYREAQVAGAHATAFTVRARDISYGDGLPSAAGKVREALFEANFSLNRMGEARPMDVVASVSPPLASVSAQMAETYQTNLEAAVAHVQGMLDEADTADPIQLRFHAGNLEGFWNVCLGGLYDRITDGIEHIRTTAAGGGVDGRRAG